MKVFLSPFRSLFHCVLCSTVIFFSTHYNAVYDCAFQMYSFIYCLFPVPVSNKGEEKKMKCNNCRSLLCCAILSSSRKVIQFISYSENFLSAHFLYVPSRFCIIALFISIYLENVEYRLASLNEQIKFPFNWRCCSINDYTLQILRICWSKSVCSS